MTRRTSSLNLAGPSPRGRVRRLFLWGVGFAAAYLAVLVIAYLAANAVIAHIDYLESRAPAQPIGR